MVKSGFAIAGGGSGLIMALVGFVPDAPVQPEGAVTGMRLAYILVPTVGALLAIWVMRDYDVTEERAKEIRAELESRRGKTLIAWPGVPLILDGRRWAVARPRLAWRRFPELPW